MVILHEVLRNSGTSYFSDRFGQVLHRITIIFAPFQRNDAGSITKNALPVSIIKRTDETWKAIMSIVFDSFSEAQEIRIGAENSSE